MSKNEAQELLERRFENSADSNLAAFEFVIRTVRSSWNTSLSHD